MGKRKEEGRERRKYNYNKEEEKDMTVMCVRGKNIKWGGGGEDGQELGRGKVTHKYININSEYDFYSNINNRHK